MRGRAATIGTGRGLRRAIARRSRKRFSMRNYANLARNGFQRNTVWNFSIQTSAFFRQPSLIRRSRPRLCRYGIDARIEHDAHASIFAAPDTLGCRRRLGPVNRSNCNLRDRAYYGRDRFCSDYERHTGLPTKQTPAERANVRHLQRLPLGLSYPAQVQHVADLLARPPLCGDENQAPAELIIDETGVGRAVGDIFIDAGLKPRRVSITAGSEVSWAGPARVHVPKTILISTVDAMLHRGVLRFAAALSEAGAMKDELQDFRGKLSDAGRATYAARTGGMMTSCWPAPLRAGGFCARHPHTPASEATGTISQHHYQEDLSNGWQGSAHSRGRSRKPGLGTLRTHLGQVNAAGRPYAAPGKRDPR